MSHAGEIPSSQPAHDAHEFGTRLAEFGVAMFHRQGEKARVLAQALEAMFKAAAPAATQPEGQEAEQAAMYRWLRQQIVGRGHVPHFLDKIARDVRAMDHEMDDAIRAVQAEGGK